MFQSNRQGVLQTQGDRDFGIQYRQLLLQCISQKRFDIPMAIQLLIRLP